MEKIYCILKYVQVRVSIKYMSEVEKSRCGEKD